MNLLAFIHIFKRNFSVMLLTALLAGGAVYYLTKDEKSVYSSKTIINTGVVSGYTILNHNSDSKIDREYTRSELQNLLTLASSYQATEELAIRLLATYVTTEKLVPEYLNDEGYVDFQLYCPPELIAEIDTMNYDAAYISIKTLLKTKNESLVKELLLSDNAFFGIEKLSTIRKSLRGSSDQIQFTYSTEDPSICQKTLKFLTDVFLEKYKLIKEGQSRNVLDYFEKATNESAAKLRDAEGKLLAFRIKNNIINYYEQTRFIADKKEDLDEFLFKEKMVIDAAKAAKEKLDAQLEKKGLLVEINSKLLSKRDELSDVTKKIASMEFLSLDQEVDTKVLTSMHQKKDKILSDMSTLTSNSQKLSFTDEGIAANNLLVKWLESVIALEQATSRLKVIENRKEEFGEIYKQFAPWGSQLKKIEREIGLAEDAYLENLHSFNQARLHLQNISMAANLKILEAPYYPDKPQGSTAIIMIAVAFIAGFMIPLAIFITLEYLDQTMKNPSAACKKHGIPLMGVFPIIKPRSHWIFSSAQIDYVTLRKKSISQLTRKLKSNALNKWTKLDARPYSVIGLGSIRGKEGVSYIAVHLKRNLEQTGNTVHVTVNHNKISVKYLSKTYKLPFKLNMITQTNLVEYITGALPKNSEFSFIVVEIPPFLNSDIPVSFWKEFDEMIVVSKANRIWTKADQLAWDNLIEKSGVKPQLMVNGVDPIIMDEFIGEVPKHRSFFRKKMKSYLKLNFSKKEIF